MPSPPDPDDRSALRPDETPAQRADRNWSEVLQELRVLQTGTQILTGFLLALAFQPAFAQLSEGDRLFYLLLVVLAVVSAVIALAPVALHRSVFQRGEKPDVVQYGHVCLLLALATVSVLLVGVVAFVFEVVVGVQGAMYAGAGLAAMIVVTWIVVPSVVRIRGRRR